MGSTDLANQYRALSTVQIAGQRSKSKKLLEFAIDSCHINGYAFLRGYQPLPHTSAHSHECFINELVEGLIRQQAQPHTPDQRTKSMYCAWKGCRPREYTKRTPLGKVVKFTVSSRSSRTCDYCTECIKALCIGRGLWAAYHDANGLIVRPEDRR